MNTVGVPLRRNKSDIELGLEPEVGIEIDLDRDMRKGQRSQKKSNASINANGGTHPEPPKYAPGYPRVAGFMSCGENLAIFRKFDRMSYGSILLQQAQLLSIEKEIDDMDKMDDDLILIDSAMQEVPENGINQEPSLRDDEMPENQRWVEIVLTIQPHTVEFQVKLRGVWARDDNYRGKLAVSMEARDDNYPRELTVSMAFEAANIGRGPIIEWQEFPSGRYWGEARWELMVPKDPNSATPLKMHGFVSDEFQERLGDYLRHETSESGISWHHGAKIHFFLKYSSESLSSGEQLNFMLMSTDRDEMSIENNQSLDAGRLWVRRLPCFRGREETKGLSSEYLPIALKEAIGYIAAQRFDALRDPEVMERSLRHEDIARLDALNRLERKLANYRSALIQHAQLALFEEPNTRGLTSLRRWFWHMDKKRENPAKLPLQGLARDIYTDRKRTDDLVALGPPSRRDKLSWLIDWTFASRLRKKGTPPMQDLGDENFFYDDTSIEYIVSWLGVLLAAGLLIGAIVGLDRLDDKAARMGTVCALTVAFALVLFFTTTSTRGEIFGASAAYAAVLVVYVGGALNK